MKYSVLVSGVAGEVRVAADDKGLERPDERFETIAMGITIARLQNPSETHVVLVEQ